MVNFKVKLGNMKLVNRISPKKYEIKGKIYSEARKLVPKKINISKKKLKELYLEKKISCPKIAKIYRCNKNTIQQRLQEYGIKRRTRSEANKVRHNLNIPKKELKRLYVEQEKSSNDIARIYSCSPSTVRRLLRECGLKVRTKSEARRLLFNIHIPKKELKNLYLGKKLSSPKIARNHKCSPGFIRNRLREYKIPIRPLQEALPLSNRPKHPQCNFNGNPEKKAYLMGFRQGDLHARVASKNSSTIFINVGSTKPELIKIVEQSFSPYGHIWKGKPTIKGIVYISCSLNRSFNFLLIKKDLIEGWILRSSKCFAAFLAGYTDAEGTFCLCGDNAVFSIKSQDRNILYQIRSKLVDLGIFLRPPQIARKEGTLDTRGTVSNKDIWAIFMHRKDSLLKLIDLLNPYLKHTDKQRRMKIVKNNVLWRNKKYNNRPGTKWYREYLKEGIKI